MSSSEEFKTLDQLEIRSAQQDLTEADDNLKFLYEYLRDEVLPEDMTYEQLVRLITEYQQQRDRAQATLKSHGIETQ